LLSFKKATALNALKYISDRTVILITIRAYLYTSRDENLILERLDIFILLSKERLLLASGCDDGKRNLMNTSMSRLASSTE
jgi:hypothetical protein